MKRKTIKWVSILTAALMVFSTPFFNSSVLASSKGIKIIEKNFGVFTQSIIFHDQDQDGYLSQKEAKDVLYISGEMGKSEIKGLKYLPKLKTIYFNGVKSGKFKLDTKAEVYLNCVGKTLNVDLKNTKLCYIYGENLEAINISKSQKLTNIGIVCKKLKKVNLSNNKKLEMVFIDGTPITKLDVSKNKNLKYLQVTNTKIKDIDVSKNQKLEHLVVYRNKLSSVDVTKNAKLEQLCVTNENVKKIDVTKNKKLTALACYDTKLSSLNVTKNAKLEELNCSNNKISSLDMSKNKNLKSLFCANNKLTKLDLSKNKNLEDLGASANKLKSLKLKSSKNVINKLKDKAVISTFKKVKTQEGYYNIDFSLKGTRTNTSYDVQIYNQNMQPFSFMFLDKGQKTGTFLWVQPGKYRIGIAPTVYLNDTRVMVESNHVFKRTVTIPKSN